MARFPQPFFRKSRRLWYVQINGRQINLGPDRDEAFRIYHQLMTDRNDPRATRHESVAEIVDAFLDWTQRQRSEATYEWYRYRLQRFVDRYPDLPVTRLRPYHVQEWVDAYQLSVTSRRNYLRSVKRCLTWAKRQGYVDENTVEYLEVPSGEAREVFITPEEFADALAHVRNREFRDLLEVTYDCGCRPQELLRVRPSDVDLENRRWVFPKSRSKSKRKSRVVYLPDTAHRITRRAMSRAEPDMALFRNTHGRPWTTEAVNCAIADLRIRLGQIEMERRGERIDESTINAKMAGLLPTRTEKGRAIKKTKAELRYEAKRKLRHSRARELAPPISLYALRHSWATNALRSGVDPLTVAVLMGHSDPSTLSRVYQHVALDPAHMLDQAIRASGGAAGSG